MLIQDFIKENWFRIAIIIILLISISSYFYWNYIRKSIIQHNCYNTAIYWSGDPLTSYRDIDHYNDVFKLHYENCLKNEGF